NSDLTCLMLTGLVRNRALAPISIWWPKSKLHLHSYLNGIVCNDGATVYATFDVKLSGKVTVYTNPKKAAINDGINLSGEGLCFKLFYVKPDSYSGVVKKGQGIGTLLPMQSVYPGITSHVLVQMCDKSDPTKYF
uniref:Uncharacterized protein n=1 Tax=Oncorhynchus kisutch TaxID=8019 RepID=A0A8C7N2K3_ONCKI